MTESPKDKALLAWIDSVERRLRLLSEGVGRPIVTLMRDLGEQNANANEAIDSLNDALRRDNEERR